MVDLHLHSSASDGTFSPQELVQLAFQLNFKAIAITDHDSVEGVAPALKAQEKYKELEVVPAVELGSDIEGRDIHFLGYLIDWESSWLKQHLSDLREARFQRAEKMVKRLRELGLELELEEVLALSGEGAVGRAHVARALLKKGQIGSVQEAFDRYLGRLAPAYVEKYAFTPREVINVIKSSGGIAVLAHPGLLKIDDRIPEFIDDGIEGLEVVHSDHLPHQVKHYEKLAEEYGLVATGGSDCHGLGSGRGLMLGSVRMPLSVLEKLKELKSIRIP